MCQFNTAVMAPDGNESLVRRLAESSRLKWVQLDNPHVMGQLEPGEAYFFTTHGMCDCGSDIGGARQPRVPFGRVPNYEQDVKKLRKRGWSDARIERRMRQQRDDQERKQADWKARQQTAGEELDRWVLFLKSVVQQGAADWIGVMHHMYRGRIDAETIPFERRWVKIDMLDPKMLHELEADVLFTLTK
ncbi:hypothetical protein [Blastopirellula marina]|uniref:Uncharacterized protein n=1 Tax=Blastopirellula marina TaxID=124 RepID=A0A2S8GMH6_9BACT|nr:hypothetical protein [Blastopirellula marina]PQO45622.1 hypothetical protein C5Y93_14390 [Blastopirellula marina]